MREGEGYLRYALVAGPGYFHGPASTDARMDRGVELFAYGPDDDGESDGTLYVDGSATESQVADLFLDYIRGARASAAAPEAAIPER